MAGQAYNPNKAPVTVSKPTAAMSLEGTGRCERDNPEVMERSREWGQRQAHTTA